MRQFNFECGRQMVRQVSSQSPVVGLRHEVHYCDVWVYTEARAVLRAVVTDFFFNCCCLEVPSDYRIRHVPTRLQSWAKL
jgi:hypothetical protein